MSCSVLVALRAIAIDLSFFSSPLIDSESDKLLDSSLKRILTAGLSVLDAYDLALLR